MGGNVLKIVLNEVQGQGTNIQTAVNQLKKQHNSQLLLMPSSLHIHKEAKYGYVDKKLCENETFDIVLRPMDRWTIKRRK